MCLTENNGTSVGVMAEAIPSHNVYTGSLYQDGRLARLYLGALKQAINALLADRDVFVRLLVV